MWRDGSCHNIDCTSPNPLAVFMWRRPQNSAVLLAITHRRLGSASEEINTQVVTCIINKWRARISEMRIYNVRDPLGIGGSGNL